MKYVDTNVLISAILNSNSTPAQAYFKAVSSPNHGMICDQNIEELQRIFKKKFPNKVDALNRFLSLALLSLTLISTPNEECENENKIRDVKDRPIFRAALMANVDIILTGDKDFLESGVDHPLSMTPADFLLL